MGHSEKTERMCNWSTESEVRKMGEELLLKDHGLEVSKIVERATDSRISIKIKSRAKSKNITPRHIIVNLLKDNKDKEDLLKVSI